MHSQGFWNLSKTWKAASRLLFHACSSPSILVIAARARSTCPMKPRQSLPPKIRVSKRSR